MRAFLRALLNPVGALWILSHTVMVLLGVVFLAAGPIHHLVGQGVTEAIGGALIASGIVSRIRRTAPGREEHRVSRRPDDRASADREHTAEQCQ